MRAFRFFPSQWMHLQETPHHPSQLVVAPHRDLLLLSEDDEEVITIETAIPPDFCKLLIQHMYHGSICFGWPTTTTINLEGNSNNDVNYNDDDNAKLMLCRYLLELMIVAEEFIVPSLVQEIEMRLVSSKPKSCFCWDCCQTLRVISSEESGGGQQQQQQQQHKAECLYMVEVGNTKTNSSMVTKESALDILGVTEYVALGLDDYYTICLAPILHNACVEPAKLWASYDKGVENNENNNDNETTNSCAWKVNSAGVSLRDAAIATILKEFGSVVNGPDFYLPTTTTTTRTEDEDEDLLLDDKESQKQLLLRTCLRELPTNSVVAASYHRESSSIGKWSRRSSKQ